MTREEREALVAAVTSAWRPRTPGTGTLRGHPAWFDLDQEGRSEAFERTLEVRAQEAALDEEGLSTTARAVLARLPPPR